MNTNNETSLFLNKSVSDDSVLMHIWTCLSLESDLGNTVWDVRALILLK